MSVLNQNLVRLITSDQGRTLYATPVAKATFDSLESKGQSNYWANFIIREIKQLRSGKFSSDYVYISTARSQGDEAFRMNLPGCSVVVHPLSYYGAMDNGYVVTDIQVDNSYEKQRNEKQTPQLMIARKKNKEWSVDANGAGNKLEKRANANSWVLVGINGNGTEPERTASVLADHIDNVKQVGAGRVDEVGFNMFFTPSAGYFDGWRAIKSAVKPESASVNNESAQLLADVMADTVKNREMKVRWITQKNGSAILTQAMRILRDKGVRLGDNHAMFLSSPTSSINSAYTLGQNLGMKFESDFYNSNPSNVIEQFGSQLLGAGALVNSGRRVMNSDDQFGLWDAGNQISSSFGGAKGVVSAVAATAGVLALIGTGPAGMVTTLAAATGKGTVAAAAGKIAGATVAVAQLAVNNSPLAKGYHQGVKGHLKNAAQRKFA